MRAATTLTLICLLAIAGSTLAERSETLALAAPSVIAIDGGSFPMGSDDADVVAAVELCAMPPAEASNCRPELFRDEQPRHEVYVSAFRIDTTEVSHRDYAHCVTRGICAPARVTALDARIGLPAQPAVGITPTEAETYCRSVNGRLPTEAEWEYAARGNSVRRFPWGQHWNSRVANHGLPGSQPSARDGYEHAAPVESFRDGKSPYGLLNLAGNVWEMTADRYAPSCYERVATTNPRCAPTGDEIVIRGGSWRSPPFTLRVTQRGSLKQNESRSDVGFRCAYDVP